MSEIIKNVKKDISYVLLAICMLSSAIVPIAQGGLWYMVGLAILLFKTLKLKKTSGRGSGSYKMFLVACVLSSAINFVFDYRLGMFIVLLFICTPIASSPKLYAFREKFLRYFLYMFPVLSIISIYCYYAGINYFSPDGADVSWDFSGLFPHPLWLGGAIGLANCVIMCWIYEAKSKMFKWCTIGLLMLSLFISVVAASRSALAASLFGMALVMFLKAKNVRKFLASAIVAGVLIGVAYPIYYSNSGRMQAKVEAGKGQQFGSRQGTWEDGFEHFEDDPIFGVGFAVQYRDGKRNVGRIESGSGWLSILFQTGLLGFAIVSSIVWRQRRLIKYLRSDSRLQMYVVCFCFLAAHSCVEGYILTSGFYLGVLFWVLLGVMDEYPQYGLNNARE